MSLFKFLFLHTLFLVASACAHCSTHFLSLGRDCQVANELKDANLRKASYPLEWMVSHNFYGIINVINDDFAYYLDPTVFVYAGQYVDNIYYQFRYNHFFPLIGQPVERENHRIGIIVPNYLDYLPAVKEIQDRRICRLQKLLQSKNTIVFIRTHASYVEAFAFMQMITNKYPGIDATLVVVNEVQDNPINWNIPKVLNFYASEKSGLLDWWSKNEWNIIFNKIHHYLNTR